MRYVFHTQYTHQMIKHLAKQNEWLMAKMNLLSLFKTILILEFLFGGLNVDLGLLYNTTTALI